jgi:hypothetical protein
MLRKLQEWRSRSRIRRLRRRVIEALALHKRGEVRSDGLSLSHYRNRLEIAWRARDIHPWDRDLASERAAQLFAEQCLADADAALERLFAALPEIDVIEFKVFQASSKAPILGGTVLREEVVAANALSPGMRLKQLGVSYRLRNWRFGPLT